MIDPAALGKLSGATVLVVGDVMLDRYLTGDTARISPEAPVPVVHVRSTGDRAGGAANVARNIAHLDGRALLLGVVGDDPEAAILESLLRAEGVTSRLLRDPGARTITKTRVLSRRQQIVRLDMEAPVTAGAASRVAGDAMALLADCNTLVISDYNKGTLAGVGGLIGAARAAGRRVLVDPKQKDFAVYRGASVITPNLAEFAAAGGDAQSTEALVDSARRILRQAGIDAMLLTRSEQGMSLITADSHHDFPAEVREVSDVTGAGDTVIATLAATLGAGFNLPDAAWLANAAAGIVVGKLGAATVSPAELAATVSRSWLAKNGAWHPSVDQSLQHIDYARAGGERLVFTNGCFDILHAGHVRYLAQARALGDRLIVGLNSDASVRRLKGADRPVNRYEDRAAVLMALACVDWVVPFGDDPADGDTPENLIRRVRPQVLAKGGDYSADTIAGAGFVRGQGGEVAVLPLLPGRSTSDTISRVRG